MKKPHVCNVEGCNASFARPYRLQIHLRKHTGERPFVCDEDECGKTYTNQSHLRRHKSIRHPKNVTEMLHCTVENCARVFRNKCALSLHLKRYHNPKGVENYECGNCERKFHKKQQLRLHRVVEHDRLFECKSCHLEFTAYAEWKKHERNNKRIHTCACGEVFQHWSILLKHRKTSPKHRYKYSCEKCDQKFVCKRNYELHKIVHEENRTVVKCPYENCERLYYYKRNLQYHIKAYHLGERKTKPKPKSEMNCKKKNRATRKDKGAIKRSTVLRLTGLKIPYEQEKELLSGQRIEPELVIDEKIHEISDDTSSDESFTSLPKRNCCQEQIFTNLKCESIIVK